MHIELPVKTPSVHTGSILWTSDGGMKVIRDEGRAGKDLNASERLSEMLLTRVTPTGEIHLERQCASEGLLTGVLPKGEFHGVTESASQALLVGVVPAGEIHLKAQYASQVSVAGVPL